DASHPPAILPLSNPDELVGFPGVFVLEHDVGCGTFGDNLTTVEEICSPAEGGDSCQIVADEQHGSAARRDFFHLSQATLLKGVVPDGQHLVDDHDLRMEMPGDRESEAHLHTARAA